MPAMIQCPTCQKEYRWKPELAGKRVKCKCGEVIDLPAQAPESDGELYDLVDAPASKSPPPSALAELQGAASPAPAVSSLDAMRDFPCPYCGEKVEGGSQMCVFCGSSLEGVTPLASQRIVPTAAQAAPPVNAPATQPRPAHAAEEVKKTRLMLIGAISLIILFVAAINFRKFMPKPAAPAETVKPEDAAIVAKVNDNGKEARDWLNASDAHMIGTGWNKRQAMSKVEELYQKGAKRVVAFGAGISSTIAVELPDDAAKRKAIFEWEEKWHTQINQTPVNDDGQKWLEIYGPK